MRMFLLGISAAIYLALVIMAISELFTIENNAIKNYSNVQGYDAVLYYGTVEAQGAIIPNRE